MDRGEDFREDEMKVYPVFLYYVGSTECALQKIFKTKEQAQDYCKLPEGCKPSGLCKLYWEEWEVI